MPPYVLVVPPFVLHVLVFVVEVHPPMMLMH